ncbi:CpsB/CapC family capsule biosynthesis tyrosine phosphatase [Enterococcus sp. ZJ1668]|uniref:tyrosine-protein phosphatase n=1 Tax=Enterococcus sp. ZJ1668 TaxID=2709402 RepID=UPI0013E9CF3F|nr:CpsB/CapC family capsule biosynthesis tyrosine phosphatase [Enterococcus sp. ZJ1668]
MIDLHCHLLPGLDDGPQTLTDSIKMAEVAVQQGITHLLATPHHNTSEFYNPKETVLAAVEAFQSELDQRKIPLTLQPGQEIRLTGSIIQLLQQDGLLGMGANSHHLLLEFPAMGVPQFTEQIFFELISLGYLPVIAHPERNPYFIQDPDRLLPFLEMGCLAQLTAPSYIGFYGRKIKRIAKKMVKHDLVQLVASDAHDEKKRSFYLKNAYTQIGRNFGREKVTRLQQTSRDIFLPQACQLTS